MGINLGAQLVEFGFFVSEQFKTDVLLFGVKIFFMTI
jgi:hypothetical protein